MSWPVLPTRPIGAPDVVTFGELMVLLRADTGVPLRAATTFHRDIAGAEGNVAVGLARLGHRVTLGLRVGADAFGSGLVAACRAEGIEVVATVDPDRPTGLLIRDVFDDRPIEVVYHRAGSAASALTPADVPVGAIAAARVLHITGITPVLSDSAAEATAIAVAAARAAATVVCFDPNLRRRLAEPAVAAARWRPIVEQSDVVLSGAVEAALLAGRSDPDGLAAWFHERGVSVVVVKDGAAGAWASDGTRRVDQPAMRVRAVDPVGAGDAFAAGFLSDLLDGGDLSACMRSGAAVAACAVQVAGDTVGLPTRAERDRLLTRDGAPGADVLR